MFEQFLQMLQGLEDGDTKANLLTGFEKLQSIHKDAIETRDKTKEQNSELSKVVEGVKGVTGLEDLSVDSLSEVIKNGKKSSDEVDMLKGKLEELQGKYQGLETTHNDYVSQVDTKNFELAVSRSDIFKDVVSDPFLRESAINKVLPKLTMGEDGNLYQKGSDGKIYRDLVTDKPVSGNELFSSMIENGEISKAVLNGTVKPGGGNEGGQGPANNTQKRSEMSHSEKGAFIKEHGEQEYFKLAK